MAHLTEAHRYLKMCIQREKKKSRRLEEAQDTPTALLCKGILQTFRVYLGQISSFLSLKFKVEVIWSRSTRQEVTREAGPRQPLLGFQRPNCGQR